MTNKTARIELRLNSEIKRKLQAAANLCGVSLTAFITAAAVAKATDVLHQQAMRELAENPSGEPDPNFVPSPCPGSDPRIG